MSSTFTHFQPPAMHAAAYVYGHPEVQPQSPYSNDGFSLYLVDPEFPANFNPAHTEDLYDEARYMPGLLGSSQFEDAEAAHQYGHVQDANNYHTSPQLVLCPKPTLPLSPLSQQCSWSDWPNEPPINVYQATTYSEPSTQATEIPYPFENQQPFTPAPQFYPTPQEHVVETAVNPNLTPRHQGDGGYIQEPSLESTPPSFEQGSTQSINIKVKYYPAHQPIRPEQRSSYSELAPHLSFMSIQAKSPVTPQPPLVPQSTHNKTPSPDNKKSPYALGLLNGPPLTSIGRKIPPPQTPPPFPSKHEVVKSNRRGPKDSTTATTKTKSTKSSSEPRRPSLACTFCRERKIACGRPPDGSIDLTCNQCARRSFRCRYLDTKSRSPLVLSRAGSKDSSSSRKRK